LGHTLKWKTTKSTVEIQLKIMRHSGAFICVWHSDEQQENFKKFFSVVTHYSKEDKKALSSGVTKLNRDDIKIFTGAVTHYGKDNIKICSIA